VRAGAFIGSVSGCNRKFAGTTSELTGLTRSTPALTDHHTQCLGAKKQRRETMSTSDVIILGGVFTANNSSQGAGAGMATTVTFDVYGVGNPGSPSSGAGSGKLADLGSVTVSLTDFGAHSYGLFGFATSSSTDYSSFIITEPSSPSLGAGGSLGQINANSTATFHAPNGTLTLFERTV